MGSVRKKIEKIFAMLLISIVAIFLFLKDSIKGEIHE